MTTLHLGVTVIPYAGTPVPSSPKVANGTQTTGDVAEWLEKKYGVFTAFYNRHEADVRAAVTESYAGAIENMLLGGPIGAPPLAQAGSEIKAAFSRFLESGEIETMGIEGVPTKAAIRRRSLRFKNKQAKGPRPSFIDSGTFEASFNAWAD